MFWRVTVIVRGCAGFPVLITTFWPKLYVGRKSASLASSGGPLPRGGEGSRPACRRRAGHVRPGEAGARDADEAARIAHGPPAGADPAQRDGGRVDVQPGRGQVRLDVLEGVGGAA